MLDDRGATPREEDDLLREYKATHEDIFLRSWLREDTRGKAKEEGKEDERRTTKKWQKSGCGSERKKFCGLPRGVHQFPSQLLSDWEPFRRTIV